MKYKVDRFCCSTGDCIICTEGMKGPVRITQLNTTSLIEARECVKTWQNRDAVAHYCRNSEWFPEHFGRKAFLECPDLPELQKAIQRFLALGFIHEFSTLKELGSSKNRRQLHDADGYPSNDTELQTAMTNHIEYYFWLSIHPTIVEHAINIGKQVCDLTVHDLDPIWI